jgi:hypothetical protein
MIAYCQYHVNTFSGKHFDGSLSEDLCVLVAAFEMRPTTHYSLNKGHLFHKRFKQEGLCSDEIIWQIFVFLLDVYGYLTI